MEPNYDRDGDLNGHDFRKQNFIGTRERRKVIVFEHSKFLSIPVGRLNLRVGENVGSHRYTDLRVVITYFSLPTIKI